MGAHLLLDPNCSPDLAPFAVSPKSGLVGRVSACRSHLSSDGKVICVLESLGCTSCRVWSRWRAAGTQHRCRWSQTELRLPGAVGTLSALVAFLGLGGSLLISSSGWETAWQECSHDLCWACSPRHLLCHEHGHSQHGSFMPKAYGWADSQGFVKMGGRNPPVIAREDTASV